MMHDKHGTPLQIGDEVHCFIRGHGSPESYGYIMGVMSFAKDDEVVCIGSEKYSGMPVNVEHLTRTGGHNAEVARRRRAEYIRLLPSAFKAEL